MLNLLHIRVDDELTYTHDSARERRGCCPQPDGAAEETNHCYARKSGSAQGLLVDGCCHRQTF
jgi:hypothetical protein